MTEWQVGAKALADQLATEDSGPAIGDPRWHDAFARTPRHVFVPRFYALDRFCSPRTLVDGADPAQRRAWLSAVYSDQVLVTDYRVGGHLDDGTEIRIGTSSASQPSVVAVMLDRLDVTDGCRVLEIGTGTGYNTALLCHRLSDGRVASVDLNPELVDSATSRLAEIGHTPRLATMDGAAGFPDAAPFDRILCTAAVTAIPPAWIDQLNPGGRIVTPLVGVWTGALAVLDKTGDDTVEGRLDRYEVNFMPLRASVDNPFHSGQQALTPPVLEDEPHQGLTPVDPGLLTDRDFQLWLQLHLPTARATLLTPDSTELRLWTGHALAIVDTAPTGPCRWRIRQYGRQRLWDTVETAYRSWQEHDRPTRTRLGITATTDPAGQRIWLDSPSSGRYWPIRATT